jgi:hypothetical protein
MKKVILSAVVLIASVCNINAQEHNHKEGEKHDHEAKKEERKEMSVAEVADAQTKHATKVLTLTAEQAKQFNAATVKRIEANRGLRAEMKATADKEAKKALKTKADANRAEFDTTVKGFLTAEQTTIWTAKKDKMHEKQEEHKEDRKKAKKGAKKEAKKIEEIEIED